MDPGYQMEPERIGRARSRRLPALVGAAAIALIVVIAKPWVSVPPALITPEPDRAAVVAASQHPTVTPATPPIAGPAWPIPDSSRTGATPASAEAEGALALLDDRRGTWGVGDTGSGPRILRDEPWFDWAAIQPEMVTDRAAQDGLARHIVIWPGSGVCTGVQAINDRPMVVAVTMPANVAGGSNVGDGWTGWWTDGGHTSSIDDSVRTVPTGDGSGIVAIERIDGTPWPVGLYEFQLRAGARTFDLTVCLTRRD